MTLTAMRYKTYTWPHNPRVYTIDYTREMVLHKVPFGLYQLQDLDRTCRVMRGEGEFVGAGAYAQFGQLANVFYDAGPGELIHPIWQTANAYFVALKLEQEPRPDYVRYSFEFWEDSGGYRTTPQLQGRASGQAGQGTSASHRVYRVARGDTLWGIARAYGVSLDALVAANPKLKNPNLIYVGDEINIP